MLEPGASTADAATQQVGASKQAVCSLRLRFARTGTTDNLPRSATLHMMTWAKDHYILNQYLRHQSLTAKETACIMPGTLNAWIYAQFVRDCLATNGLYARSPYHSSVLTDGHRQRRVQWHNTLTRQNWWMILFSDEFRFALSRGDGGVHIYRHRNEDYADCFILQGDGFMGGRSVVVWAGIW